MKWKLAGYEIEQGENEKFYWGVYTIEGGDGDGKCFTGRAWLEHGTILLSTWKAVDYAPDELQTEDAIAKYFESLPAWDKSKYYLKLADIGMSGLMICATNEPAPDYEADVIMPKLGFEKKPAGAIL